MANSGNDLRPIVLDLLAGTAAVAELAPGKIGGEISLREGEPGGHPFDDRAEGAAVRFARGQEAEPAHGCGPSVRRGGPGRLAFGGVSAGSV